MKDWSIMIVCAVSILFLIRVRFDVIFCSIIILRFLYFTNFYGVDGCWMYLTVYIAFLRIAFSSPSILIARILNIFLFLLTISMDRILGKWLPFCPSIEDERRIRANTISRLYVVIHFVFEILKFKYYSTSKEQDLSREASELERMEKSELGFMKRFSHFMKTNMNGIINFLYVLKKDLLGSSKEKKKDAEIEERYEMIESSSIDIIHQTKDLVGYYQSRHPELNTSELEELSISRQVTNIREGLSYVVNTQKKLRFEVLEKKKGQIRVDVTIPASVPPYVSLDPSHVLQILNNTISNAFKYTTEGSISIFVDCIPSICEKLLDDDVDSEEEESSNVELIIKIVDTGKGITKEMLKKVYEPYVVNEQEDKKQDESFSIGLYGVKNTLKTLEGSIEITSEGRNKGTTCEVRIPCQIIRPEEIEEENEEQKITISQCQDLSHVLIVEDNLINQKVFEKQVTTHLGHNDVEVVIANNGKEGLEKLSKISYSNPLILCDIDMPIMNGYRFTEKVREIYGNQFVIYCVTATILGTRDHYIQSGFNDVEAKPIGFKKMGVLLFEMIKERGRKMNKKKVFNKDDERFFPEEFLRKRRISVAPRKTTSSAPSSCSSSPTSTPAKRKNTMKERLKRNVISKEDDILSVSSGRSFRSVQSSSFSDSINEESKTCKRMKYKLKIDQKRFSVDMIAAFACVFSVWFGYFLCTEKDADLKNGWWWHSFSYAVTVIIQFSASKFLNLSYDTHFILTSLRNLYSFSFGSLVTKVCLSLKGGYVLQVAMILETVTSVDSLFASFTLVFLYLLEICFFELTRDIKYLLLDNAVSGGIDTVGAIYLCVMTFTLPSLMKETIEEKKERLENIIEGKKSIDKDLNNMMSRISHDLSAPAQTLLFHLQEVGPILEKKCDGRMDRVTFRDLSYSSIVLEVSIRNFLICCKLRNGMAQTHRRDLFPVIYTFDSMKKNLMVLKDPECDFQISYDDNENHNNLSIMKTTKIKADYFSIQLIVINLFLNALVHSNSTNISVTIKIIKNLQGSKFSCVINVEDDGIGIEKEKLKYLNKFQPKKEMKFHFKERFCNTLGLGLIVCKCLSNEIGGSFIFKKIRSGTNVEISFPCEVVIEKESEEEEKEGEEEEEENNLSLDSFVVVLDDQITVLSFMKMYLGKIGFTNVHATTRWEEALGVINGEKRVDILITDYKLGGNFNAIDLLQMIEQKPQVILCASGCSEDEIKKDNEGVFENIKIDGYISKPILMGTLKGCLNNFVKLY